MATARPNYYCHKCQRHIGHVANFECPHCRESFIEEAPAPQQTLSHSRSGQPRGAQGTIQFHGSTPYGNTTIVFGSQAPHEGGGPPQTYGDFGNLLQTIFTQFTGGLGGQQGPIYINNGGPGGFLDAANLDAFLTQLLNQAGENSGPPPARPDRINSIPTVKVTAAQARDNLQCAICMDDFKEGDEAKRLPCSHHFHQDCITRWLQLHGTCPTCRVTLDGDNTSNREYSPFQPNQQRPTSQPPPDSNRRNGNGNSGSGAATGGGGFSLFDFD